MSGGPPYYGFSSGPQGGPPPPGYYPGMPANFQPATPAYPGVPSAHFPMHPPHNTNMYPVHTSHTTSNYFPGGETHFSSSFVPQSNADFSLMSGSSWVQWHSGQMMPPNAVVGGRDCDGSTIYVGRLQHKHDILPAKVLPLKKVAYICYDGKEIAYSHCEILCRPHVNWVHSSNGHVPPGAIPVGHTEKGETLYIARANHNGSLTVGKLHPSHRTCYIPFGGREISVPYYEVLTA